MLKTLLLTPALVLTFAVSAPAQNANTSTTRSRQTTTTKTTTTNSKSPVTTGEAQDETPQTTTPPPATKRTPATPRTPRASAAESASAKGVRAAFDALIDGITRADVEAVMNAYWNSPQLILFNNNGTVTRSWSQVRENRLSSYPNLKDVKIAVRDVRVQVLGADAALVTCLWTQTQTYKGTPETASGRLSLAYRRVGNAWKVVHTHTSPDRPDPSLIPPSEQQDTTTTTKPTKP